MSTKPRNNLKTMGCYAPPLTLMMELNVSTESTRRFQPVSLTRKLPDFSSEKDDSLVLFMALKDEDLEIANGACAEFYKRHFSFLVAFGRGRRWEKNNQPIEGFVD